METGCDPGSLQARQVSILLRISTLDQRLSSWQFCESSSSSPAHLLLLPVRSTPLVTSTLAIPIHSSIPGAIGGAEVGPRPLLPLERISCSSVGGFSQEGPSNAVGLASRQKAILQRIFQSELDLSILMHSSAGRKTIGSAKTQELSPPSWRCDGRKASPDAGGGGLSTREQNGIPSECGAVRCSDSINRVGELRGNGQSLQGDFGQVSNTNGRGREQLLTSMLKKAEATFEFKRAPPDYYEQSFEARREVLGAASIDHLCKSIVMVNTQAPDAVVDCSDRMNSKYYVVVVQYTARLNAEKVRNFLYALNDRKIPRKRFNMRLAPEEVSSALTGFEHNAVTPFGMKTEIPVILSSQIEVLRPDFFWLGGGEVDLKLGIKTEDFMRIVNPFVADCVY